VLQERSMNYSELNVPEQIHKAVERMGFTEMTEVQEKAIPPMMEGKDIIAKAPTGTGKTCAFGIPLILGLDQSRNYPQAVVMAPTRELAQQITEDLQDLAHFYPDIRVVTVYGGANIQKQIEKLKKGAQIVVATPGRLQDHMNRRTVDLSHVTTVVLDEADEMLNMGFYKDVRKILDQIKSRQRLAMFSATISREVMDIGWLYQRDAEEITVQPVEDSAPRIDQYLVLTTGRNKLADMAEIIVQKGYKRVMVFCNQKYTTAMLANQMARLNFVVDCLHGDLSQAERNKIMGEFKAGNIAVLVATDVAARGIDVSEVDAVFNYDVPDSNEYYTHRIGRTGRAKHTGEAYVLYTKEEHKRVRDMLRYTRNTATPIAFDESRSIIPGTF
jgi:ATP-dependent RNA helicase DeaD